VPRLAPERHTVEEGGDAFLVFAAQTYKQAAATLRQEAAPFQMLFMLIMLVAGRKKAATLRALATKIGVSAWQVWCHFQGCIDHCHQVLAPLPRARKASSASPPSASSAPRTPHPLKPLSLVYRSAVLRLCLGCFLICVQYVVAALNTGQGQGSACPWPKLPSFNARPRRGAGRLDTCPQPRCIDRGSAYSSHPSR